MDSSEMSAWQGSVEMWESVRIQGLESQSPRLFEEIDEVGLDIDAQSMHHRFLADLPHLDDAITDHRRVVEESSQTVEPALAQVRSIGTPSVTIEEIDAASARRGFDLDLSLTELSDLSVQSSFDGERTMIRIIAAERFGGSIRTFRLPPNIGLQAAFLSEGVLHFSFE
jgi:hypothetical protein